MQLNRTVKALKTNMIYLCWTFCCLSDSVWSYLTFGSHERCAHVAQPLLSRLVFTATFNFDVRVVLKYKYSCSELLISHYLLVCVS